MKIFAINIMKRQYGQLYVLYFILRLTLNNTLTSSENTLKVVYGNDSIRHGQRNRCMPSLITKVMFKLIE